MRILVGSRTQAAHLLGGLLLEIDVERIYDTEVELTYTGLDERARDDCPSDENYSTAVHDCSLYLHDPVDILCTA